MKNEYSLNIMPIRIIKSVLFRTLRVFIGSMFTAIAVFYGCKDNNVDASDAFKNYFPLQVGNEWTFQFLYWTPTSGDTLIDLNYKIIKTKQINGKDYYGFNSRMPFFPLKSIIKNLDSIFVRQNEKGDVMLLVDSVEYHYLLFSNPFNTDSSNIVNSPIEGVRYYHSTESINGIVTTPIGQFTECHIIYNYFPQIRGLEYRIWFAPGYGPVKIYYPELDITYQLVKINIQDK